MTETDRIFQLLQEQRRETAAGHERLERAIANSNREHTAAHIRMEEKLERRLDQRDGQVDEQIGGLRDDISSLRVRLAIALGSLGSLTAAAGHNSLGNLIHAVGVFGSIHIRL